jgi:2-methylcitrate dehydratase PrpD
VSERVEEDGPEIEPGGGVAHAFAQRLQALAPRDLSADVLHWARVGLLDTLGVTLAGSREPAVRLAAQALAVCDGPALWLGQRRRLHPLDAALLNGTAAHALDFDDSSNTMGGHPSAPVLSALLPLVDELGCSGSDFMLAYVAGFELECKLALAVNFHHYTKGWHPTATLGVFGAAAACAKLMRLDTTQTATALALAASFASGIKANFGTMAKPLHVGHAARNGQFAARLARSGFSASSERAFEHEHGFLEVFNGAGTYDMARGLAAWAAPMDIVSPGIAIKQYPCCGSTHPAIDAMLALVREHALLADDVVTIEAWIHARRLQHTHRPDPRTALDAKFSLQYVLARALIDGCVALSHFENDAHLEPRVRALLPRIRVATYDDTRFDPANHFGGAVRVTLANGQVLEATVEQPLGRTSANPLPAERLQEKFRLCAAAVLREDRIAGIASQIDAIATLRDLRRLTRAIEEATMETSP